MASEPAGIDIKAQSRSDSFVERMVVENKFATAAEVKACVVRQAKLRASGREATLADILVKNGFVTRTQIERLGSPSDDSGGTRGLQQIPGFQIMQKIGAGAMATVYKARQISLDRIVAIKVLPKRLSENPEFVERFSKEGRAAAKLNHNNIVQAIDVGESGGYHYFVMEFVDGITVYDEMIKGVFDEQRALDIIIQVARALEHAHARGFIHRDVKPKNIMITKDGTAKLADMGLARAAGDEDAAAAEAGRAYGTPYYISPEQVRGERTIDFRTDIYSLGATFYHMVTGKVPFDGPTPAAVMHKHLKEPLTPPDHVNSRLSTGLAEIIERMMAKDRNRRYTTTTDVLVDLEKLRRGEAPLQARSGYTDGLLQNLADGHSDDALIIDAPARTTTGTRAGSPLVTVVIAMGAMIVLLLVVILILLINR